MSRWDWLRECTPLMTDWLHRVQRVTSNQNGEEIAQIYSDVFTGFGTHHYRQPNEPMVMGEVPITAWEKVGVNLFHCNGKDCLLTIDYLSNYPEIPLLSSTTANMVILHGIPLVVVSENAPDIAPGFKVFAEHYEFRHNL